MLPCLASPGALRGGELDPQGVVFLQVDTPFPLLPPLHLPPQPLPHTCVQGLRGLTSPMWDYLLYRAPPPSVSS